MPARSFAIDCWASRLLFLGVANGGLRIFLENHRCSPRGHSFFTRWQLGPEFTIVEFQCSNCSQIQGMAVRTPFNLFGDPVAEYLYDGWPELTWDSVISSWQLRHKTHVEGDDAQFTLSRSFSNGRIVFSLVCPCGSLSPPSFGWALEGTTMAAPVDRSTYHSSNLPVSEPPKVIKSTLNNPERLVRHRASGRIYRLPPLTVYLDPVEAGEAQPLSCSVENLWSEFDRFYGSEEARRVQTWHERLAKE